MVVEGIHPMVIHLRHPHHTILPIKARMANLLMAMVMVEEPGHPMAGMLGEHGI